jgi:hypothetical protein
MHIPLVRYEDPSKPDEVVLATAAVKGARQMEGSLVWRGAFPAAFVARAARVYAEGQLSGQDAARLEHYYGARIIGSAYYSIGKGGKGMDENERTEPDAVPAGAEVETTETVTTLEVTIDVPTALAAVAAAAPAPAQTNADEQLAATTQALEALRDLATSTAATRAGVAIGNPEDAVRLLGVLAGEAVYARGTLIEACVGERVRARGATDWDSQGYRSRLTRFTLPELEQELQDLSGQTASVWSSQRQIPSQVGQRDGAEEATERQLSPVELFALRGA